MLVGKDTRKKPRKVLDYIKNNGGIVVGASVFIIGFLLFIFSDWLKLLGVAQ